MNRVGDLTGKRFGRWLVLQKDKCSVNRDSLWKCECNCGKVRSVSQPNLVSGTSKSCGCLRNEKSSSRATQGKTTSPEYRAYQNMKARCNNPNRKDFDHYGGRGIKVCVRWLDQHHGFENFFEDMGMRPSPKHTLDRKDVNGDYCPENCRWVTQREQVLNRRVIKKHSSEYKGVGWKKQSKKWTARLVVEGKLKQIGYFENEVDAALAWDKAAREQGYEEAWLNFPKKEP